MNASTTTPRIVRINAIKTGVNFGWTATIKARNGREIWEGRCFGTKRAALEEAAYKARHEGWTVANG